MTVNVCLFDNYIVSDTLGCIIITYIISKPHNVFNKLSQHKGSFYTKKIGNW